MRWCTAGIPGALAAALVVACSGGGGGGNGGEGGTSTQSGTGAQGGSDTGGATGSSAGTTVTGSGGAAPLCTAGATEPCYRGPAGTEGVGVCHGGTRTCAADGHSWSTCAGEVTPQPADCATPAVDEACTGDPGPCADPPLFAALYGGDNDQMGDALATDAAGNIYLAGTYAGEIDFGAGQLPTSGGLFLVKLDPQGHPLWQKSWKSGYVRSMAVDPQGGVTLLGAFWGAVDYGGGPLGVAGGESLFVLSLDAAGGHRWSKAFAASLPDYWDWFVAGGPSGEVVITTTFDDPVDLGGGTLAALGKEDILVARFDAQGHHTWSKRFGGAGGDFITAAAVDTNGDVLLTGYGPGVDFGGGPIGAQGKAFLVRLDAQGKHLWSKAFGGAAGLSASGMSLDGAGNIAVAGLSNGDVDLGGGLRHAAPAGERCFAGKFSPTGAHLWSLAFGCHANPYVPLGPRVAADHSGGVAVVGSFDGTADFGFGPVTSHNADAFLLRLDPSGAPLWAKTFSSKAYDLGLAVATDPAGHVIAAGHVEASADLGAGLLTNQGDFDVFLVKR